MPPRLGQLRCADSVLLPAVHCPGPRISVPDAGGRGGRCCMLGFMDPARGVAPNPAPLTCLGAHWRSRYRADRWKIDAEEDEGRRGESQGRGSRRRRRAAANSNAEEVRQPQPRVRAERVASEALDGGASSPRAAQPGPQPGGELPQADRSVATS
jgi:hypothetical protein